MPISFKLLRDPMTGDISTTQFQYTDEQGTVWTVPIGAGHRFETEVYAQWYAEGNRIEPADPLPQYGG
jgi:hypothetical protein